MCAHVCMHGFVGNSYSLKAYLLFGNTFPSKLALTSHIRTKEKGSGVRVQLERKLIFSMKHVLKTY